MDAIRELRIASGLSQKELGEILGVAESTICNYETNRREPDIQTLIRIARYFEVSVDELLGLESQALRREPVRKADNEIADRIKQEIKSFEDRIRELLVESEKCEQIAQEMTMRIITLNHDMAVSREIINKLKELIQDEAK